MFKKEIVIHSVFKEWLGEKSTLGDILFTFGTALVGTLLLILGSYNELADLSLWQNILFSVVTFDIIGGCVANFTEPTDRYYASNNGKRWVFLAEHLVHITLLYIATGAYLLFWLSVFIYTIGSGAAVHTIKSGKLQQLAAAILVTIGCILFYGIYNAGTPLVQWFPALFMVKIIFGFAVRRTEYGEDQINIKNV